MVEKINEGSWQPGSLGYEAELALFEHERGTIDLALRSDGLIDVAISIDDNDFVLPAIPPALLAELGRRLVEATSPEVIAVNSGV